VIRGDVFFFFFSSMRQRNSVTKKYRTLAFPLDGLQLLGVAFGIFGKRAALRCAPVHVVAYSYGRQS
jgi:hypothetical protein